MSLLKFFHEIKKLKDLKRTGWKNFNVRNPESIADHSFRVSVMTLIFASRLKLNKEKALKMALIHDLCETYSGDLIEGKISKRKKFDSEKKGMKKILSELNKKERSELMHLWNEFMEEKNREAKIVREIDRLEMAFSAVEYEKEQKKGKKLIDSFIPLVEKRLKEKELIVLLEELKKESK